MDIILLQRIKNLGKLGDKVSVKAGYGRNYLIPQGQAVAATESNTAAFTKPELPMHIQHIREYLPHRYPFLLVDRIVDVTDNAIVGYKNVSINEEFLQGHFPGYPIMPGVLIVEALAQVSGILGFIMNNEKPSEGSLFLFAGV